MNILVLQHLAVEHPGIFRDFMREDGFDWTTVELDSGEPIPDLTDFDLMLVMGGPQDVWQGREHPWLREEIAAIRHFVVDLQRPFLGICLGHQLLATAIGGRVAPAQKPEVGVMTVSKTDAGQDDAVLGGLADPMTVLQWHGAEVVTLPDRAVVLASSEDCGVQAFRFCDYAYGLQCHIEITEDTVAEWAAVPAYAKSLEAAMGHGAINNLAKKVAGLLPSFRRDARSVYEGIIGISESRRGPVRVVPRQLAG